MKVINGLKLAIYKADFFKSSNLLRVKGEPDHQTLLGGIISISIMLALTVTFYNKVIDTLNKVVITSSAVTSNADDPLAFNLTTLQNGPFMFGVQIWHHDLNTGKRYFDIVLTNTIYNYGIPLNTSIQYALQPCTRQHWNGYPQIQKQYQKLSMSYWMCLPMNMTFEIKGKYSSVESKTLDVSVKKCINSSFYSRPCATQAQIDQMFTDNGTLFFTIYFLNSLINPDSQKYLKYYLQDSNYITFSKNGGEQSRIFVQDYQINTDESILPNTDLLTLNGGFVVDSPLKSTYSTITDTYAIFFFFKSPISTVIDRSFQKLDNVLSYIGGLFGTILIAFFLINSYNSHKFEVNIAGYLYGRQNKSLQFEKSYNFFYYVGQLLYTLLKNFRCKPKWQKISYFYRTRQQILKQLDVLFLFKRINFLEKALTYIFTEDQIKGIHLASHITMSEAIRIRKSYKLKSKLRQQIENKSPSNPKTFAHQQNITDLIIQNGNKSNPRHEKPQSQVSIQKLGENEELSDSFKSDQYSSIESSSDEEDDRKVFESINKLNRQQQQNQVSKKILKGIDRRLQFLLDPIFKNQQRTQIQIIHQENENQSSQQESHVNNMLFFESTHDNQKQCSRQLFPNLKVVYPESQLKINGQDH